MACLPEEIRALLDERDRVMARREEVIAEIGEWYGAVRVEFRRRGLLTTPPGEIDRAAHIAQGKTQYERALLALETHDGPVAPTSIAQDIGWRRDDTRVATYLGRAVKRGDAAKTEYGKYERAWQVEIGEGE